MKNYLIFGFILSIIFIPITSYAENVELEISEPKIVDSIGNTVDDIFAPLNGVPFAYQPSAILKNTGTSPIDFTFYAMVDDGNELLELSSFSASINPNQDFTLALTWNPQKEGKHTLIFGVWNNLGEKNDLITPIELDVNVLSKDSSTNSIQIASFVDETKDPQSYIDRYNNEESYKEWFDENYPQYDSIEQAVGMPETLKEKVPTWIKNNAKWWSEGNIDDDTFVSGVQFLMKEKIVNIPDLPEQSLEKIKPTFVDETKDPQSYIDRYNNEESYKEWFDENYPDYTIEEAVGIPKPIPGWIKNNADWWSEGLISEDEFVKGIEFLVENRILIVN